MTDRKARLAALAARAGRTRQAPELGEQDRVDQGNEAQTVQFRNYAPQDKELETKADDDERQEEPSFKKQKVEGGKSVLEEALQKAKEDVQAVSETEVATMAPKKINWDLKRDVQGKLDKLERRTQRAIVKLLKARLEKEAAESTDNLD